MPIAKIMNLDFLAIFLFLCSELSNYLFRLDPFFSTGALGTQAVWVQGDTRSLVGFHYANHDPNGTFKSAYSHAVNSCVQTRTINNII